MRLRCLNSFCRISVGVNVGQYGHEHALEGCQLKISMLKVRTERSTDAAATVMLEGIRSAGDLVGLRSSALALTNSKREC